MNDLIPIANSNAAFQTGTKLDQLVAQYQGLAGQTAEGTVKLGLTILEAERLGAQQLTAFCERVKLDRKGATYRKLRAIGQAADDFRPILNRLPSSWTTLYQLAKLPPYQLEQIAKDERFGPNTTAVQLQSILSGRSFQAKSNNFKRDIHIDVTQVGDLTSLFVRLDELASDLAIDYRCRKGLNKANYRRKPYDFKAVPGDGPKPH